MADGPKKFGRYFLLDLLAQGGMAEIYRARLASEDGAGRLLVIKRIQAGFGSNAEFLSMFKSEIKVTMGFNHPNIVQLYDFGEEARQPFIAMEYVDGKNLRQFMSRFLELKQRFPIDLAVHIIEQAACGLHYAHSFKDKISGKPLNIVHRDISPQNLLISFEGTVKVIDFGIAKATVNAEATRAGVIKGKPSYLSPEQINGDVLDGRSDLFSLGTVLWELLAGRKLFAGENDLAVLKLIESCQTYVKPPSTLNPNVPPELDYIVLKALAKQRDKRYQSTEEFQRALHKFLYSHAPEFNPSDLAYYAKDLFKKEIVEERKKIQRLNNEVEVLIMKPIPVSPMEENTVGGESTQSGSESQDSTKVAPRMPTFAVFESSGTDTKVEMERKPNGLPPPRYRSLSHSNAAMQVGQNPTPQTRSNAAPFGTKSTHNNNTNEAPLNRSLLELEEKHTMSGHSSSGAKNPYERAHAQAQWIRRLIPLAAAGFVAVALFGPRYGIQIPYVSDLVGQVMGKAHPSQIVLNGDIQNVKITANGQVYPVTSLPATLKDVPEGVPLSIVVTTPNGGRWGEILTLRKGEEREFNVTLSGERSLASETTPVTGGDAPSQPQPAQPAPQDPTDLTSPQSQPPQQAAENGRTIRLHLNIYPGGGSPILTLNGKRINPDSPIIAVPLDTPLELTAERQGFKPYSSQFYIESRTVGTLREWTKDVQMEPKRYGTLSVRTTPSADAYIVLDDGKPWVKRTPFENEKVPVGTYNIKLVNEVLGMGKTLTIHVQEGKVINLDERLEITDN